MLRCDRCDPCSSCKIRDISCTYTPGIQSKPVQKERKLVNDSLDRIRRLEELVSSLASGSKSSSPASSIGSAGSTANTDSQRTGNSIPGTGPNDSLKPQELATNLGKIRIEGDQTVYVSAAHWATIQDEVLLECKIVRTLTDR